MGWSVFEHSLPCAFHGYDSEICMCRCMAPSIGRKERCDVVYAQNWPRACIAVLVMMQGAIYETSSENKRKTSQYMVET